MTLEDIAKSNGLYGGMDVYWIGGPQMRGEFYRTSHITSIREVKGYTDEDGIKDFLDNSFTINTGLKDGTSGKPIWSGNKIIGVAHYRLDGLGYMKLMDEFIEVINDYELKKK